MQRTCGPGWGMVACTSENSGLAGLARALPDQRGTSDVDIPMATKDPLDDFVTAAADALALPLHPAWKPAVRTHLEITLKHAALVEAFDLPDDAEPAPVFRA